MTKRVSASQHIMLWEGKGLHFAHFNLTYVFQGGYPSKRKTLLDLQYLAKGLESMGSLAAASLALITS